MRAGRKGLIVSVIVVAALGCNKVPANHSSSAPQASSSATPRHVMSNQPPPQSGLITEKDSGKTFEVAIGQKMSIRLINGFVWTAPERRGSSVELAPVNYKSDPGFVEYAITTVRSGKTIITSQGTENCGSTSCPGKMSFTVTIVVP
ncbi:MAG: hypothetical protein LC723_03380 [Actinobacteria bacterium]|nr:hypothetical protein [Actinomycetota bacterium]